MATRRHDRLDWEYADGPTVGEDVPITSEPREEETPGVPAEPPTDDATKRRQDPGTEPVDGSTDLPPPGSQ